MRWSQPFSRLSHNHRVRAFLLTGVLVLLGTLTGLVLLLQLYILALERSEESYTVVEPVTPFPVGVDPRTGSITELPSADQYYQKLLADQSVMHLSQDDSSWRRWVNHLVHNNRLWQQFASPMTRVLVIWPGERKEQAIDLFGDILQWNSSQRAEFSELVLAPHASLTEGVFLPGRYVVQRDATPQMVAQLVNERFYEAIGQRYTKEVAAQVPLSDALTIASLLQREAYGAEDMRIISGVIWNRLFSDMNLQIDATLQYVKGSRPYGPWWPKVIPADKYLPSEYNTYLNPGLPPAPIANPSVEAVFAALNPRETECFYYFHDSDGSFYCSSSYKEHVAKLKAIYGQGR